jgi:hypothetical protein
MPQQCYNKKNQNKKTMKNPKTTNQAKAPKKKLEANTTIKNKTRNFIKRAKAGGYEKVIFVLTNVHQIITFYARS